MRKRSATLAVAAALGFMGLTATPALAIDNVVCKDGAGFTEIINEKRHCFANAGKADVFITNVSDIHAGNNNITIWFRDVYGNWGDRHVNRGRSWADIRPRITVEDIQIH